MNVDMALEESAKSKMTTTVGTGPGTSGNGLGGSNNDSFIHVNPPMDTKPTFLEREASMLEVQNFI